MEIERLTLGQIKEIQSVCGTTKPKHESLFKVGEKYFIRTATFFHLGRLKQVNSKWLVLEDASWIADTGRFHDFLKSGKCNEYEAFVDDVYVPVDSIIDITKWGHELYKGQK